MKLCSVVTIFGLIAVVASAPTPQFLRGMTSRLFVVQKQSFFRAFQSIVMKNYYFVEAPSSF